MGLPPGTAPTRSCSSFRNCGELNALREQFFEAARAAARLLASPKGGQLDTDLNRDLLAAETKRHGVRPVRQISVDEVWSALPFRTA